MRDFASLYFINRHTTFVCGTLFLEIKLNYLHPRKQSSTYKSAILADIYIEKQITQIRSFTMVQYTAAVGRVRTRVRSMARAVHAYAPRESNQLNLPIRHS